MVPWAVSRNVRDSILFVVGLAGTVYETVFEHVDRPQLLILLAGMMGLPALFRTDERPKPKRKVKR